MKLHPPRHFQKRTALIIVCLLITMFMFFPATAEEQTNTHVYNRLSDQSASKSLAKDPEQISPLKESDPQPTVAHTLPVGFEVEVEAWYETLDVGRTILFQRSEDGIIWCTYHTGVTGPDGKAYIYGYTETCPGTVYYRAADETGVGSSVPSYSIEWVQTVPATTCIPQPSCAYSITCIENYDHICDPNGKNCNIPGSIQECDNFADNLRKAGLAQNFYDKDGDVAAEDFGTDPTYSGHTITESVFHYHSGHGTDPGHLGVLTYLNLKGYDPVNPLNGKVGADDVAGKWGGKLKWVMLDSCNLLKDKNWGKALTTSHGILGFSTDSGVNLTFPATFMKYALNKDFTIVGAYKQATIDIFHDDSIIATVITKTSDQYHLDHFPGTGPMAPDDDSSVNPFVRQWKCRSGIEW
jgi:hypothetical protein